MTDARPSLEALRVRIFADGADSAAIASLAARPYVAGFTTNPTLMRKAGVSDYRSFAKDVLGVVGERPVSFEVIADEFTEMERQAREIGSWGRNVYVKIPVTNTRGEPALDLIRKLSADGFQLNVTALMTLDQVRDVSAALGEGTPCCLSLFAGRLADTGRDPMPVVARAVELMARRPNQQLVWASPREVLNVFHADAVGCHIITMTRDLLEKLPLVGTDPGEFSLETVRMFHRDALQAGYDL